MKRERERKLANDSFLMRDERRALCVYYGDDLVKSLCTQTDNTLAPHLERASGVLLISLSHNLFITSSPRESDPSAESSLPPSVRLSSKGDA